MFVIMFRQFLACSSSLLFGSVLKLTEMVRLSHIQESECVFKFFCPHQHSSLSRLCCLVSSHSLGLNSEAAQGALQSEHEYLVGGHHAPCVLFMRPEWRGWQCNIFETLINQAGQLTHD